MGRRFQRDRRVEKSNRFERKSREREAENKRTGKAPLSSVNSFQADAELDLHGMRPEEALRQVATMVESGRYAGGTLLVIHGKGLHGNTYGALKEKVRSWGSNSALVERMWYGENAGLPGQDGVTLFFL